MVTPKQSKSKPEVVTVEFYGQTIEAVLHQDRVWVIVRRMCENLGIDLSNQMKKIKDNLAFNGLYSDITIQHPSGAKSTFCLDLEALTLWLGGISASKVKKSIRSMLIKYQRECMCVLNEHFFGGRNKLSLTPLALPMEQLAMSFPTARPSLASFQSFMAEVKQDITQGKIPVKEHTANRGITICVGTDAYETLAKIRCSLQVVFGTDAPSNGDIVSAALSLLEMSFAMHELRNWIVKEALIRRQAAKNAMAHRAS